MVQLGAANANHRDNDDLDRLVGGLDSWEHPRNLLRVAEIEVELVYYTVGAYCSRQKTHVHRRRVTMDEVILIEAVEVLEADAPSPAMRVSLEIAKVTLR